MSEYCEPRETLRLCGREVGGMMDLWRLLVGAFMELCRRNILPFRL